MKRVFKTVTVKADTIKEVDIELALIASALYSEKYEVVSHCVYKDEHDPYTLIISVLAKKDSFL